MCSLYTTFFFYVCLDISIVNDTICHVIYLKFSKYLVFFISIYIYIMYVKWQNKPNITILLWVQYHDIIYYHPSPNLFFYAIVFFLHLGTSVYCNIWLLNIMEGMSQSTNNAKKMSFKSYLFIIWKKCPHTKHDKLGYHPIHCTHYTDY